MTALAVAETFSNAQPSGHFDPVALVLPVVLILGTMLGMWWMSGYDKPDDDSGPGGWGGPPPPKPPRPPGPIWWPQFERDFATYVETVGVRGTTRERIHAP